MRSIRSRGYFAVALTFSLLIAMAAPAFAVANKKISRTHLENDKHVAARGESIKESIKNRDGRSEFSTAELEEMRSALAELLSATYYATPLFDKGLVAGQTADDYAAISAQIKRLSATELTALRTALNPVSMKQKLQIAFEKINSAKSPSGSRPETAGVPAISYFCQGQAEVLGISAPVDPGALSASDDIFFIAEGVRDIAQNGCNQVGGAVVAGAGVIANTRLACNVSDAIYLVAKGLNQKIRFCDDDYNSSTVTAIYGGIGHLNTDIANGIASTATSITSSQAAITANAIVNKDEIKNNDNANATSIVNNDNTNKNTIVSNDDTNKTIIVTNDNANKDIILTNANANYVALTNTVNTALASIIGNANANKDEIKNLLLRTQIEADLSVNDGQPFVGLYQLPASMCFASFDSAGVALSFPQQCGLLDLVRSIVQQTIVNTGNNANALRSFNRADADRTQAKYAEAYKNYRKAYKEAMK